jgi:hypothetical protein
MNARSMEKRKRAQAAGDELLETLPFIFTAPR